MAKRTQVLTPTNGINLTVYPKAGQVIKPGDALVLDTTDALGYGVKLAGANEAPLFVAMIGNEIGEARTKRNAISAKVVGKYNTVLSLPSDDSANIGDYVLPDGNGLYVKETVAEAGTPKGFLVVYKDSKKVEVLF